MSILLDCRWRLSLCWERIAWEETLCPSDIKRWSAIQSTTEEYRKLIEQAIEIEDEWRAGNCDHLCKAVEWESFHSTWNRDNFFDDGNYSSRHQDLSKGNSHWSGKRWKKIASSSPTPEETSTTYRCRSSREKQRILCINKPKDRSDKKKTTKLMGNAFRVVRWQINLKAN